MMEPQLTPKEAYAAMYLFLCELYDNFGYDQLGGILGGMSVLQDGMPADPAIWTDWLRMIEKVKTQHPDIRLHIKRDGASDNGGPA
jgi:hypothetical protein